MTMALRQPTAIESGLFVNPRFAMRLAVRHSKYAVQSVLKTKGDFVKPTMEKAISNPRIDKAIALPHPVSMPCSTATPFRFDQ
jgi:hypothetical protein